MVVNTGFVISIQEHEVQFLRYSIFYCSTWWTYCLVVVLVDFIFNVVEYICGI